MRDLLNPLLAGLSACALLACGGASTGNNSAAADAGADAGIEACAVATPNVWTPMSTAGAPSPRTAMQTIWTGDRAIFFGGDIVGGDAALDGGIYDPCTDKWTPVPTAPSAGVVPTFAVPALVWTGKHLILWGGLGTREGGAPPLAAMFAPKTGAWTPMSREGEPNGQFARAWTGSTLFVWGGSGEGALFNPDTNRWAKVSSTNAPPKLVNVSATWASDRVFVWGEITPPPASGEHSYVGATYDPALDAWSPVTKDGAPEGQYFVVLWTGDKLAVWGRSNVDKPGLMHALFDPKARTWSPIPDSPESPEPSASAWLFPVWTGRELALFGGQSGFGKTVGLLFDPAKNTWRRAADVGAPDAGLSPEARVAGGRVLIVSGSIPPGATRFDIYDPDANTWQSTKQLKPRDLSSVVWTGRRILAWGGTDGEVYGLP